MKYSTKKKLNFLVQKSVSSEIEKGNCSYFQAKQYSNYRWDFDEKTFFVYIFHLRKLNKNMWKLSLSWQLH